MFGAELSHSTDGRRVSEADVEATAAGRHLRWTEANAAIMPFLGCGRFRGDRRQLHAGFVQPRDLQTEGRRRAERSRLAGADASWIGCPDSNSDSFHIRLAYSQRIHFLNDIAQLAARREAYD
jgi:hypothetical protein